MISKERRELKPNGSAVGIFVSNLLPEIGLPKEWHYASAKEFEEIPHIKNILSRKNFEGFQILDLGICSDLVERKRDGWTCSFVGHLFGGTLGFLYRNDKQEKKMAKKRPKKCRGENDKES